MLLDILRGQQLSSEWVSNVADRNGAILARSSNNEKSVGTTLPAPLSAQQAGTVLRTKSLEGGQVLRATALSQLFAWQIAVNIPVVWMRSLGAVRVLAGGGPSFFHVTQSVVTDVTVAEVAQSFGYESEPAFNRAFKRHLGIPPGAAKRARRSPAGH